MKFPKYVRFLTLEKNFSVFLKVFVTKRLSHVLYYIEGYF